MYVAISVHTKVGTYCGQGREGKEKQQGKVSPRVVGSDWKSLSGCHVPSTVPSSPALRTPGHYCHVPYGRRQCKGPLAPYPHITMSLCCIHHTRALCASPFSGILSALDPCPRSCTEPPPIFLFWGHGATHLPH